MISRNGGRNRNPEAGFTLVELLVVIVILGILSAVVVFAVRRADDKGKGAAVATDERIIRTAQESYCAQKGKYAAMGTAAREPGTLVGDGYLSGPSEIHTAEIVDANDPDRQGNCGTDPSTKHYKIVCRIANCGIDPSVPETDVPSWQPTGSLRTPRSGHTATLLDNGDVLVVGGFDDPTPDKFDAEVYNPASKSWTPTAKPPLPAQRGTATRLTNGKVLVIAPNDPGQPMAQFYNPDGTWETVDALPPGTIFNHTATLLASGKVLVTGLNHTCVLGGGSSDAVVFDPNPPVAGANWGPPIPMTTERWGGGARAIGGLPGGKVLVAGGQTCTGNAIRPAGAEIFDPTTGAFLPTGPTPHEMTQTSNMTLIAGPPSKCGPNCGKVLMTGISITSNNAAQLFDPGSNTWTAAANTLNGHSFGTATLLLNGKVLVAGSFGFSANAAELYDPATGTWEPTHPMLHGIGYATATLLSGGDVLVAAGQVPGSGSTGPPRRLDVAQLYVPG